MTFIKIKYMYNGRRQIQTLKEKSVVYQRPGSFQGPAQLDSTALWRTHDVPGICWSTSGSLQPVGPMWPSSLSAVPLPVPSTTPASHSPSRCWHSLVQLHLLPLLPSAPLMLPQCLVGHYLPVPTGSLPRRFPPPFEESFTWTWVGPAYTWCRWPCTVC